MSAVALVRDLSPRIAECALTHLARTPIDVERARSQHERYCAVLADLGARVEYLPPLADLADGVFVEDTAVVVDELAVATRPGAASRRAEVESTAAALAAYRPVRQLPEGAWLDGGDVLQAGRTIYVGRSSRTTEAGIGALAALLEPHGYEVEAVELDGCLHLKTACTFVPPRFLAVNPAWVDPARFRGLTPVVVDPEEPFGANTLTLGGVTLVGAAFPRTEARLRALGLVTRQVDLSELAKAEGALTCSSVILSVPPGDRRVT